MMGAYLIDEPSVKISNQGNKLPKFGTHFVKTCKMSKNCSNPGPMNPVHPKHFFFDSYIIQDCEIQNFDDYKEEFGNLKFWNCQFLEGLKNESI